MDSKLVIKRLDGGADEEVDIEISDVSKTGVGFVCKSPTLQSGQRKYSTHFCRSYVSSFVKICTITEHLLSACLRWMQRESRHTRLSQKTEYKEEFLQCLTA